MMQGRVLCERLEERRFLSVSEAAVDIGLLDAPVDHPAVVVGSKVVATDVTLVTPPTLTLTETVGLPLLVRTYSGNYSDPTIGLTATLRMTIRRQVDRGGYASLRGSFTAVTNAFGTVTGDITYGKVRPSPNLHVNITIQGTVQNVPYTATIDGKASLSGSQIKGNFNFASALGNSNGTFLLAKVVKTA